VEVIAFLIVNKELYVVSPDFSDDGELEYALALANRSAALMSLENYGSAIEDIEEALSNGYPEDLYLRRKNGGKLNGGLYFYY
jgi:hypothetical protein